MDPHGLAVMTDKKDYPASHSLGLKGHDERGIIVDRTI
jgi:hypothetical protein